MFETWVLKNIPNVAYECCKRQLKWVPSVWGYSRTPCPWGLYQGNGPPSRRLGVGPTTLPCKNTPCFEV